MAIAGITWRAGLIALGLTILAACATIEFPLSGRTTGSGGLLGGTVATTAGGNVLGYTVSPDARSTTLVGALLPAGRGYWGGHPAEDRLRRAHAAAIEIADLEARAKVPFEAPKLFARVADDRPDSLALFARMEAQLPADLVAIRSHDATIVLRRLGAFAGSERLPVMIEAPSESARLYMQNELIAGARGVEFDLSAREAVEPRVILGDATFDPKAGGRRN